MRIAMIVVSMLVVVTPSLGSESCMTVTEARRHFGSVHIYWHGADHCWDATPSRLYQGKEVQQRNDQLVEQKNDQPKWRDSMSEMLPDAAPALTVVRQPGELDNSAATTPWAGRWVNIIQVAPPPSVVQPRPEPMVGSPITALKAEPSPRVVMLVLCVVALAISTIVVVFRRAIYL